MNTYNHVALTYAKNTGVAVIYVNGIAVKTQNLGIFTPQTQPKLDTLLPRLKEGTPLHSEALALQKTL